MSAAAQNENRQNPRISLSLSVVVKAREDKDNFWKETTDLISMSRSGAGFYLERKCEVGQLVSLMLPMPRHLRCYDADKELYRVWGLIQHCSPVADDSSFHVGVAFIGKNPPVSYQENPLQSYRIAGMNGDGTWRIVEAKSAFVIRRHPRYWVPMQVLLSARDDQNNLVTDEKASTENISMSGAAVYSSLKVNIGDSVNFDCIPHNFSSLAIVRNRQSFNEGLPKLHIEFIDTMFPIEEVSLPIGNDILDEEEFSDN